MNRKSRYSKRAWSFDVMYNEIFIFCRYYVLSVIVPTYLQYILTVYTLMFIVKQYLSICICSYTFGFWVSIHSFFISMVYFTVNVSIFFFSASNQASDKLKVWYYFMILKMTQRWVEGMFLWERLCLWEWRIFQLIYRLCL